MSAFTPEVLLRGEQSAGNASLILNTVPARWPGPPLHRHDFDEAFYILEGELTFQLGDALVSRGPGELVFAPRGADHTLANQGDAPARYLLLCTPAGFERYFDALAAGAEITDELRATWPEVVTVGPQIGDRRPE